MLLQCSLIEFVSASTGVYPSNVVIAFACINVMPSSQPTFSQCRLRKLDKLYIVWIRSIVYLIERNMHVMGIRVFTASLPIS